jgi:phosphatidylglycerol:prolipoprotein diacylglycerol transferase
MFPLIRLGPFLLQTPGLVLLASFWLASSVAEKEAARRHLAATSLSSGIFYGLVAGLIGSRLSYVARYLNNYLADPISILSPNPSTLAPAEGLIVGLLVAAIYVWRQRLPLRSTLDALAPGLAVLAVGLGFAHLASGSAFGAPAELPWTIYLWDDYRHPSQVYEILAALLIFGLVWRARAVNPFSGFLFLSWSTLAAGARLFLESFRGDSVAVFAGLRQAQFVALALLLLCLWLMGKWARAGNENIPPPLPTTVNEPMGSAQTKPPS